MNDENLVSLATRSKRERSEIGRKGAEATNRIKREKKTLKQELEALLEIADKNGDTLQKKISFAMIQKAGKGDTKAYEVIRDTIGQKPKENVSLEVDKVKQEAIELLQNIKNTVEVVDNANENEQETN